jgi:hypothetical protein
LREQFVQAAAQIGERLVRDAVPAPHGCTWRLPRSGGTESGTEPATELATGKLYDGTAGIALFLAELYGVRGSPDVARTARRALDFALDFAATLPDTSFGLHAGRVGIAYAAVRAGLRLGADLREPAEAVLRPLLGNEGRDGGLDVISGAAGAIPALLWLSDHVDPALARGMARRLGAHLCALAKRHPGGWCWGASPASSRAPCGFSHGASGMAHALLELYHATGEGAWRYAAEQAMLYERGFLSPERGNWPDFRHPGVGEPMAEGRLPELRERLRAGETLGPRPPRYPCFWCHGAPGIGLARLRAYQVLGGPGYLREARIAVHTATASLDDTGANYSLCHGAGGNSETLMMAARVLGDDALAEPAVRCALRAIARYDGAREPWPCGTQDGTADPGLLLGEAGIGLFLLRLADPGIPSVLLVSPARAAGPAGGGDDDGYRRARVRAVEDYFGNTLDRLAALGCGREALVPLEPVDDAPAVSDVTAAYTAIRARVEGERDPARRRLMQEAFLLDRTRYELLASIEDLAVEYAESLARSTPQEVDWATSRFGLGPRTRIAETSEGVYLVHRSGADVATAELAPLAAAVLRNLSAPAGVDEVTAAVHVAGADAGIQERVRASVREQLLRAYHAGLIEEIRAPVPVPQ